MKKICFCIFIFLLFCVNIYAEKFEVEFNKCVDGDTFKITIDDEVKTVRMLAIDTPETVKPGVEVQPYGKEASDFTCDKLTNAKKIELEYDSKSTKADKYGRLLAWVYVDGEMLQKELISIGYAKVAYIYGKYSYLDDLYELEEMAAESKSGLWSEEEYKPADKEKEDNNEVKDNKDKDEEEESILSSIIDDIKKTIKKYLNKMIKSIVNKISDFISGLLESIIS